MVGRTRTFFVSAATLAALGVPGGGERAIAGETRTVVELFTSQGCSSCPPADKLLGELANDPSMIALSFPVDYWDYLGWKDTLASPQFSQRQRNYSRSRGDRDVFTPQAVVNGTKSTIGSDRAAVEAAARSGNLSVNVETVRHDNDLVIRLPASDASASGEVWLLSVQSRATVDIGRGENSNRTVTYHNVVRRMTRLGDWDGKSATFTVPLKDATRDGADLAAVILQEGSGERPGLIRGAALAKLR